MALAAGFGAQASAQDVTPPKAYTTTPGGINVSDGALVYSQTDLSMGPLSLERYHRSGSPQPNNGMFGTYFSNNFDIFLAKRPAGGSYSRITVHIGNTATGTYEHAVPSATAYAYNLDAEKGILSWNGSQYVYRDASGTTYTFSATVTAIGAIYQSTSRRVERIDFPDGRRQTFSYTAGSKPKLVEDSSGYAIVFDYNGNGDVSAACIFKRAETYVSTSTTCTGAQLKTTYGYTGSLLTSVVDAGGQTTTYTNTFPLGVTCIKPPGYATCTMSLTGAGSSTSPSYWRTQTLADGGVWNVTGYDAAAVPKGDDSAPAPYDGHLEVAVTDPQNQVTQLLFTKSSPFSISDPLQRGTAFSFEGGVPIFDPWAAFSYGSMLREATYPEGDKYQADYNGPFRAISAERHVPKGGGTPLEKLYSYQSCTVFPGTYQNCAKPIATRDPAGNWTNYTYAAHGGVLTEMGPAPVVNGARPLKVTSWVQRYAWLKNSGGTLVQNVSFPVWVKDTETVCQTVAGSSPAPVCDGSALQTVTSYEYGANGTGQSLMIKGVVVTANGTGLRTCYGYDPFDRKIFETQPNANLSSCP